MNGNNPDTVTFTIKKTKALFGSIAAIAGSAVFVGGLIVGAVQWGVNEVFEDRIKNDLKDPKSELCLRLDDIIEEKVTEVIQVVVDDDMAYHELRLDRIEEDVKRLEEASD